MTPNSDNGPSQADRPPVSQPPRGVVGLMRRFPATSITAITCITLFLAVFDYDRTHPGDRLGGLSRYGAVTNLKLGDGKELHGPFQLWDGEWWRVFVTGFHHANLIHILFNILGLIYLGRLLESRIGSVRLFVFLLAATSISLIPPLVMGGGVVGLSGGIYAMFGLLFVMRRDDVALQYLLPDRTVQLAFLWIPIGMVLTATGVMPISNLGHASGLAYGLLAGWVFTPPLGWRRWRFSGPAFLVAHLLVVPAIDLAMNPVWNARYHWYLASQPGRELTDRIAHLELAVQQNPQLSGAWRLLAEYYRIQNDADKMWKALLTGMSHNRSDGKLAQQAAAYWKQSWPSQRAAALRQLQSVFGEQADSWREQLGFTEQVAAVVPKPQSTPRNAVLFWPLSEEPPSGVPQPQAAPRVNPDDPGSAREGERL